MRLLGIVLESAGFLGPVLRPQLLCVCSSRLFLVLDGSACTLKSGTTWYGGSVAYFRRNQDRLYSRTHTALTGEPSEASFLIFPVDGQIILKIWEWYRGAIICFCFLLPRGIFLCSWRLSASHRSISVPLHCNHCCISPFLAGCKSIPLICSQFRFGPDRILC